MAGLDLDESHVLDRKKNTQRARELIQSEVLQWEEQNRNTKQSDLKRKEACPDGKTSVARSWSGTWCGGWSQQMLKFAISTMYYTLLSETNYDNTIANSEMLSPKCCESIYRKDRKYQGVECLFVCFIIRYFNENICSVKSMNTCRRRNNAHFVIKYQGWHMKARGLISDGVLVKHK